MQRGLTIQKTVLAYAYESLALLSVACLPNAGMVRVISFRAVPVLQKGGGLP